MIGSTKMFYLYLYLYLYRMFGGPCTLCTIQMTGSTNNKDAENEIEGHNGSIVKFKFKGSYKRLPEAQLSKHMLPCIDRHISNKLLEIQNRRLNIVHIYVTRLKAKIWNQLCSWLTEFKQCKSHPEWQRQRQRQITSRELPEVPMEISILSGLSASLGSNSQKTTKTKVSEKS